MRSRVRALRRTARPVGDGGSVLLEALAGIALLTVLTASLVPFHASALQAVRSAEARHDAVRFAERLLEEHAVSSTIGATPDPAGGAAASEDGPAVVQVRLPIAGDACAHHPGTGIRGLRVEVPLRHDHGRVADPHGGDAIVLAGSPLWRGAVGGVGDEHGAGAEAFGSAGAAAHVHLPPTVAPGTLLHLAARGAAGPVGPTVVSDDCISAEVPGPGAYELRLIDPTGSTYVDALQRRAADAPLPVGIAGTSVRTGWVVAPAAWLTVVVDVAGARLPDLVSPGALRWLVRGDDTWVTTAIDASRTVHPGIVDVVVSACANAESPGSSARVTVGSGTETTVQVALATVTVRNVAAHPGASLRLIRTTGCLDGGGLRPLLGWEGGLVEGMRIALPHGEWEGQLQTSAGARITGPVLIRATGGDTEAVMP